MSFGSKIISHMLSKLRDGPRSNEKKGENSALPLFIPNSALTSFDTIIPLEVKSLLWFKNGPFKNYNQDTISETEIHSDYYSFSSKCYGTEEPSVLDSTLSIDAFSNEPTPPLPYFPTYSEMTPTQRGKYLKWLCDITKPVEIGYVFVFYYGLERHLFLGKFDQAFRMIFSLLEFHHNKSFRAYAINALLCCGIFRKNPALIKEVLNASLYNDSIDLLSPISLLCRYYCDGKLYPREVMLLAKKVGFTNNRYIKSDENQFLDQLTKQILIRFNKDYVELNLYSISECLFTPVSFVANISLENLRNVKIPLLLHNDNFRNDLKSCLVAAHNQVKLLKKQKGDKPI